MTNEKKKPDSGNERDSDSGEQARENTQSNGVAPACPIPISEYPNILLAHGGGGRLTNALVDNMFVPTFDNTILDTRHDGAVFQIGDTSIAMSTDSYVVKPLFFPGGDIGSLAVHGTVNDLAMCGARPMFLSAGFVMEEGLPMDTLWKIVRSMQKAAKAAGVRIVTGDTKVVDRGKGDQLFINTSGVGIMESSRPIRPDRIEPGDAILLSGDIGRHGMAVMAAREGLEFEHTIESDSAPLGGIVTKLLASPAFVRCMRDLTRGGLAGALVEIAEAVGIQIDIDEAAIPVRDDVRGACEILGLEPVHVANEGRFIVFVPGDDVDDALEVLRVHPLGAGAVLIGHVSDGTAGRVTLKTRIGTTSVLDMPSGEQLPRIC